ncbi:MAG TPA: pseudouridine synthase [Polyangia bacterium]|nr:pseudouridine synthase [Polyangia bacterium]
MIIPVLHRDDRLVLVDKPPGLVVHRGWADDDGGVLVALRDQLGQRVWPLHRLDRGASGVLAFALDHQTASVVGQAFADGRVEKKYLALVRGRPPDHLIIDHPIPAKPDGPRVPAVTEIRRLGTWERYALVEAVPRTGRLHQIRRHLKHIACPLIGDVNYGKGEHNRIFRQRFGLDRLALHALSLRLPASDDGGAIHAFTVPSGTLADCLRALDLLALVPTPGS